MKANVLFGLLAIAAVATGCKKEITEPTVGSDPDGLIRLNSGVGILMSSKAEATVSPERTDAGFVVGDKIGVTAVFSKKQAESSGSEADEPNWGLTAAGTRHFTNEEATALAVVDTNPFNGFTWTTPQYYPQGRQIFLYAYYPYHDGATEPTNGVKLIKNTQDDKVTERDSLQVTLQPEAITDADQSSKILKQPDVMVASHAKATVSTPGSIFRKSPEADTRLVFRHLLSQLQFTICKEPEVQGDVVFKSLTVYMPPIATFPIGGVDDDMKLGAVPMTTETTPKPDYAKFVKYTFTPASMDAMPEKANDKEPQVIFDRLSDYTPFMTFPLSKEQLQTYAKMELVVNLGEGYGDKTFTIQGDHFSAGLKQGHVNTINFTVNYVLVSLTGSVSAWGTAGSAIDVPIE